MARTVSPHELGSLMHVVELAYNADTAGTFGPYAASGNTKRAATLVAHLAGAGTSVRHMGAFVEEAARTAREVGALGAAWHMPHARRSLARLEANGCGISAAHGLVVKMVAAVAAG